MWRIFRPREPYTEHGPVALDPVEAGGFGVRLKGGLIGQPSGLTYPLPQGEGQGEGTKSTFFVFPHPVFLPKGEGTVYERLPKSPELWG